LFYSSLLQLCDCQFINVIERVVRTK